MQLHLKNVGVIKDGTIDVSGLTVIVAQGGMGKTTICKSLYATLLASQHLTTKVVNVKRSQIVNLLCEAVVQSRTEHSAEFNRQLLDRSIILAKQLINENTVVQAPSAINKIVNQHVEEFGLHNEARDWLLKQIRPIAQSSLLEAFKTFYAYQYQNAFHGQIHNIYEKDQRSSISLTHGDKTTEITFRNSKIVDLINPVEFDEVPILIDNFARLFDELSFSVDKKPISKETTVPAVSGQTDQQQLSQETRAVVDLLEKEAKGKLISTKHYGITFLSFMNSKPKLDLRNLDSRQKTFLSLAELIKQGHLKENTCLIIDTADGFLHPAQQVELAAILIRLQRILDLRLVITTHSPYVLGALESLTNKEHFQGAKFYHLTKEEICVQLTDISNNLGVAYNELTQPYQVIEDLDE